jgi:hypothetical protein
MTINPEKLHNHVMMDINDFVRGKTIAWLRVMKLNIRQNDLSWS